MERKGEHADEREPEEEDVARLPGYNLQCFRVLEQLQQHGQVVHLVRKEPDCNTASGQLRSLFQRSPRLLTYGFRSTDFGKKVDEVGEASGARGGEGRVG